jgi:hypothetical protein
MDLAKRVLAAVRAHPGLTMCRLSMILLDVDERELDQVLRPSDTKDD